MPLLTTKIVDSSGASGNPDHGLESLRRKEFTQKLVALQENLGSTLGRREAAPTLPVLEDGV